ncbi:MAG TPA: hypothetical protein PLW70_03765 [Bacteroidales bacterium]|nr:hypothetical protein [Bacteroidales bacterium]HQB19263.1 hypothetical protein [Bacteroidales bacterium]
MKTKTFLIVLLLTGIFWNCGRQCILPKEVIGTGEIVSNALVPHPEKIPLNLRNGNFCIREDSLNIYNLQVSFDGGNYYEAIDFSKYTVLGKYTNGGGCSVVYERNVSKNISNKKILYSITVHQCGYCDMYSECMNWVLVPKIPEDYTIEYKVIKK